MSRFMQQLALVLVPLALALAWAGGDMRQHQGVALQLANISPEIEGLTRIDEGVFQGYLKGNPEELLYIAHEDHVSYGGPLRTAVVVGKDKIIRYVAVLDSDDTRSYLEKVVDKGILDPYPGRSIDDLPQVDGVSGATLSSAAITGGIVSAARQINAKGFGAQVSPAQVKEAPTPETAKILLICLFYLAALVITRKGFKPKRRARSVLLLLSVIILGFWFGTQFSLSTVVSLLSGTWLKGMATYAALLCLILAVVVFLVTKKNLFCNFICPFGAVQEGLGRITGCSPPKSSSWMKWIARGWVLAVLMAALYFQTPSDAMYEPFSKAFNFVGSGVVYGLTILIVIASLIIKRPWCNLFCPVQVMFFYLGFARKHCKVKTGIRILPKYKEVKEAKQ